MARVGLNVEERGAELYRRCILNTHLAYRTHFLGADFVHEFHGFKGDTATNTTKPATLETGVTIQVPTFVEIGDVLQIDSRDGRFVKRV